MRPERPASFLQHNVPHLLFLPLLPLNLYYHHYCYHYFGIILIRKIFLINAVTPGWAA